MAESLHLAPLLLLLICALAAGWWHFRRRRTRTFLLGYACYKPPDDRKMGSELCEYIMRRVLPEPPMESFQFQVNMHLKSGIGQETYAPASFLNTQEDGTNAELLCEAWKEAEEAFTGTLDRLFADTDTNPATDIDIVIVNVCCFAPMPSLSAWIVNRYAMRRDVKTFNFSGMGCSAGLIAVAAARDLLRVHRGARVLVASTENLTLNRYMGCDRNMMLTNCLFRVGGSALLLSNRPEDEGTAKMELLHVVRTNLARDDDAYGAIVLREDEEGVAGCALSPSLVHAAARALRENLGVLGPRVLPLAEQLRYAVRALRRRVLGPKATAAPVVPDFRTAFEHFCIHPGGRTVITGIGKSLGLGEAEMEAAMMTLHRFGNTSASGLWYEVAYLEAKEGCVKEGNRLLQIALGSGFKCATAVWQFLRRPSSVEFNVWKDCIERYPCSTRNPFESSLRRKYKITSGGGGGSKKDPAA